MEDGKEMGVIDFNTKAIIARNKAYMQRQQAAQGVSITHQTPPADPPRWTPVHADIATAEELFAFLSPEVRRFAVAIEAQLRGSGCFTEGEDGGLRVFDCERPHQIHNSMLIQARRLLEAIKHRGVTDFLSRPLATDHPDRNPRRIAIVLREAVNVACHLVMITNACGALGDDRG